MLHQLILLSFFIPTHTPLAREAIPTLASKELPAPLPVLEDGCEDSRLVGLQVSSKQWG